MAEMSPVELLRAGAVAAQGGPRPQGGSWLLGELGNTIAALLTDAAERHAPIGDTVTYLDGSGRVEHNTVCRYCSGQLDCSAGDWPCADVRPALAMARVLPGVPDDH